MDNNIDPKFKERFPINYYIKNEMSENSFKQEFIGRPEFVMTNEETKQRIKYWYDKTR